MIHKRNIYIPIVMAIGLMLVALTACQDEPFYDSNNTQFETNLVMFDAYIGAPSPAARSAEDPTDLPPVVMDGDDFPLYLHRYVCDNSFDPAETDISPATRGVQINNMETLITEYEDFKVRALFTNTSNVYFNTTPAQQITNSGGKWKPGPANFYWPGDDSSLTFYAWAPKTISDGTSGSPEDGVSNFRSGMDATTGEEQISFNYVAETSKDGTRDAVEQTDLLLAISTCKKSESTGGVAPLEFIHPLSAIKFAVRDVMDCTVTGISIENVYKTGTCTYTLSKGADWQYSKEENNKGTFHQKFDVVLNDQSQKDNDKIIPITDSDKDMGATFMMVPQEIPDDAMIALRVKFNVKDEDGNDVYENGKVITKEMILRSKITDFDKNKETNITQWLPGKEYVYVISTSSSNWTYVFDVLGSYQSEYTLNPAQSNDPANLELYPITERNDALEVNHTVYNTLINADSKAYYKVRSYRYRTNNPYNKEIVPWTVAYSEGENEVAGQFQDYATNINAVGTLQPYQWIPETETSLRDGWTYLPSSSARSEGEVVQFTGGRGPGSVLPTRYDISFHPQYVATDYAGDWWLRRDDRDLNNSAETAQDLSLQFDPPKRNTANCYLVNRGGWYKLPLVYGNAITGDETNVNSYTFSGEDLPQYKYKKFTDPANENWDVKTAGPFAALKTFVDYKGVAINDPWITHKYEPADATLVWEDAKGTIDKVQLSDDKQFLVFHVDKTSLQQANSVVAVLDASGTIMWSWHIWVTDYCHWAINTADQSPAGLGSTPDMPVDEAVECDIWDKNAPLTKKSFYIAPVNLGWCDRKNVGYLQRTGNFAFTQLSDSFDEHPAKQATRTLAVKQRSHIINFWIGNNPYYMYGRKDPGVGLINGFGRDKETFGPRPYDYDAPEAGSTSLFPSRKDLAFGIQNPDKSYMRLRSITETYNLWNNYFDPDHVNIFEGAQVNEKGETTENDRNSNFEQEWATDHPKLGEKYSYSAVKTVYDPSPPGFVVPPFKFFDIFTKGRNWGSTHGDNASINDFNGECNLITNPDNYNGKHLYYIFKGKSGRDGSGTSPVYFRPTGHRWGQVQFSNMLVYLSSNTLVLCFNAHYTMVLGVENVNNHLLITSAWRCDSDYADAVRCVKEFDNPE